MQSRGTARFSPDVPPRWVVYQSDETGRFEIYIQAFPHPNRKLRISHSGGQYPLWRRDGREIFYVSLDRRIMVVTVTPYGDALTASEPKALFQLPETDWFAIGFDVSADGQRFLVRVPRQPGPHPLEAIVNWQSLLK
jgi:hypothetical protein